MQRIPSVCVQPCNGRVHFSLFGQAPLIHTFGHAERQWVASDRRGEEEGIAGDSNGDIEKTIMPEEGLWTHAAAAASTRDTHM